MFEEEELKGRLYNVVFVWKLAYTIPFLINSTIYYIQYQQDCDLGCAFLHEILYAMYIYQLSKKCTFH